MGTPRFDRRAALSGGLAGAAIGALRSRGLALGPPPLPDTGALPLAESHPIERVPDLPDSIQVDGLPFARWFTGDLFPNPSIPFHGGLGCANGDLPPVEEEHRVVVVGGGVSGLGAAWLLRDLKPVVLELRPRFGGAAQGESWAGTPYSLGNAYVITPDAGSFLEELYRELRLDQVVRVDDEESEVEIAGQVLQSVFDAPATDPALAAAFRAYREAVAHYAGEAYPDVPVPVASDPALLQLDTRTLREDLELRTGGPLPEPLAGYVQAYCYSSFAAGWEEISAYSGWNFLAAEEYGRWVFPGGTSYLARQLFEGLAQLDAAFSAGRAPVHLRGGCTVFDVRLERGGTVRVSYLDSDGACHGLRARKVVMAAPKLSAKHAIHDLAALDEEKSAAMHDLEYRAYVVANVLLERPVALDFYDIFQHLGPPYPAGQGEAEKHSRVTDVLNGAFAQPAPQPRHVLTLYWPLPYDYARWTLLHEDGFHDYSTSIAPQVRETLALLGVPEAAVRQVRLTRWGHAMPIARPGLIASGATHHLRRPIDDRLYFVNQDNWALPAVENSLLDARHFEPAIRAGL